MSKIRKIQLYPSIERIHTAYKSLISNPPEGYEFVGSKKSKKEEIIEKLRSYDLIKKAYKKFIKIFKSTRVLEYSYDTKILDNVELIFSTGSIYYGNKKWVLDIIDNPYSIAGYNYGLFLKNKKKIEKALLKNNCRKIICANESSVELMKKHFSKELNKKVVLVRPAVNMNKIINKEKSNKIKLLFIGSINNPKDFYFKGGLNALSVFEKISRKYANVELIIRCILPEEVRERVKSNPNITLLEDRIPFDELISLYVNSDILLCPSHTYIGLMTFLEGMYFKLPILTLNTYAVEDYIIDKYNGLIVEKSKKIKGYYDESYPANSKSEKFIDETKNIDEIVINDLVEKLDFLIKNPNIRKKMGDNSRKIIDKKFTIKVRNKGLKKLFDRII